MRLALLQKRLHHIARYTYRFSAVCISTALFGIILLVAWQVFTRYVLNDTAVWVSELVTLLMIWMLYLGCSLGIHDKEVVFISLWTKTLRPRTRHAVNIIADLFLLAFVIVMIAVNGEILSLSRTTPMPVLRISKVWVHVSLTVGFGMTTLYVITDVVDTIVALTASGPGCEES